MKNRYIPFGYQIQNGDSVINTEQAATVQHIFYAYTEGQSFKEIAEYLTTSGTAYHFSDNSWNKNIVARILTVEPKDTQPLFQKKFTAKLPASEAIKP